MTETVHGQYVVTSHRFTRTVQSAACPQPLVEIRLHQFVHQADEPAPHRAYVREDELNNPAYQLGAIWKLVFSGDNARDEDQEDS